MPALRLLCLATLLWTGAPQAMAQESGATQPAQPQGDATTLETIRVTAPRPETPDPDGFRNPSERPSVFDRVWNEPRSLEQVGMDGGVIPIIVDYTLRKVTAGARMIPGWKPPIQPAVARPPPMSDAQMERAARLQEAGSSP